jgi:UDP-2-acetamido-3-amino-2,3-dideoxy-glucuronate N-acetyltransferase
MIHPTADVSPDAKIGTNVKIWHQAQVREGAIIGNNCIIAKNVYIDKNVEIENNCKIQNNSSIYHKTKLENGVFIGPHCILTNDKNPRAISNEKEIKISDKWSEGKILVKEGASLGAGAIVLPDITIGKYALIGAGSIITKNVPDYGLIYGNPARLKGFVCKCGNKITENKNQGDFCENCSLNLS